MGSKRRGKILSRVVITGVVLTMVSVDVFPIISYATGFNEGELTTLEEPSSPELLEEGYIEEETLITEGELHIEDSTEESVSTVNDNQEGVTGGDGLTDSVDEEETEEITEESKVTEEVPESDMRVQPMNVSVQATNTYVLAKDTDFKGTSNGNFRYIGTGSYVEIPSTIKGVRVTSYESMFLETKVKGVKSTNRNVKYFSTMFADFQGSTLDISQLDTTGAINMFGMFMGTTNYQTALESIIGLNTMNTSNVQTMERMFYRSSVKDLDLTNFNTTKVTDMSWMFSESLAQGLNVSSFDTTNVVGMDGMFSLTLPETLDVRGFNTSKVSYMGYMFSGSKATTIKGLENFNTSLVYSMVGMFKDTKVTSINTSNFDTSRVESMSEMFSNTLAQSLNLTNFNTKEVTDMSRMFQGAKAESIDVRSFDTTKVTTMNSMFRDTQAKELDLGSFTTGNVKDMIYMFRNSLATHINVSTFDTRKVEKMTQMFSGSMVEELDLSGFNTQKVSDMGEMFRDSKVKVLDLTRFNTSRITDMSSLFRGSSATTIDLSSFDTTYVISMNSMFKDSNVEELDLSSFNMGSVNDTNDMFHNVKVLSGVARASVDAVKLNVSQNKPSTLSFNPLYVLATDEDFSGFYSGIFRYIGDDDYVEVPHTIKGTSVTSYKGMFKNTDVLGVISTNTNIRDMSDMFKGTTSSKLNVKTMNTEKVTDMSGMFEESEAFELDLTGFLTGNVVDMSTMFRNTKVNELDLGSFNLTKVTNTSNMFQNTTALLGYVRTGGDLAVLNASINKPAQLIFSVWGISTVQNTDDWTNEPVVIGIRAESSKAGIGYVEMVNETGRNFVLDSKNFSNFDSNNGASNPLDMGYDDVVGANWMSGVNIYYDEYEITTYVLDTFEEGRGYVYSEELYPIPEELTYSISVMSPKPLTVNLSSGESETNYLTLEPNKWVRLEQTVTSPDSERPESLQVELDESIPLGTKLYYKEYKIEKGKTATPWKPAPEDSGDTGGDGDNFTVYSNGTYIFRATDTNGDTKTVAHTVSNMDTINPTAKVTSSPDGWTSQDVTIYVEAEDELSGIAYITLPNGNKVTGNSVEYLATDNGIYNFKVTDNAGNTTTYTEEVRNIDKTVPKLESNIIDVTWTRGTVDVEITSGESASGLVDIKLVSGQEVTEPPLIGKTKVYRLDKNGLYTYKATYNNGTTSEVTVNVTNIDRGAPEVTVTGNVTGWTEEDTVELTIKSKDTKSGIKSITLPNGEVVLSGEYAYPISKNGEYEIIVEDNVGNKTVHKETVKYMMVDYYFYIRDELGNPVEGANFELLRNNEYYKSATSNDEGLVDFGKIPPEGVYGVRQLTAPGGVVINPEDIESVEVNESVEIIKYPNGVELPASGTYGLLGYVGLSILLVLSTLLNKKRITK